MIHTSHYDVACEHRLTLWRLNGMERGAMLEQDNERLESWKEISAHLRKSVRTIQRWERQAGLPVRRVKMGGKAVVFAYRSDLDKWWTQRSTKGWRRWLRVMMFWKK